MTSGTDGALISWEKVR